MRKYIIVYIYCSIVFVLCSDISIINAMSKASIKDSLSLYLHYIPTAVRPGDKPVTLSDDLLLDILPELKNPRIMTINDLSDPEEISFFTEGGYTFVLRGDFNNDGFADIVFVGKYENINNNDEECFICIISIKNKLVVREFYSTLPNSSVSLLRIIKYKNNIDGIRIVYKILSDHNEIIYWTGKKWKFE